MNFFKSSLLTMLSVVFRALAALGINKLFALYFGAAGVALLAHFQNLTGILIAIPNDGVNRGMIKYSASPDAVIRQKAWQAGLFWNVAIMLFSAILLLLFPQYFIHEFDAASQPLWIVLLITGFFIYVLHFFALGVLLSEQKLRLHTVINVFSSIIVLIVCGLAIVYWQCSLLWSLAFFWIGTSCIGLVSLWLVGIKTFALFGNWRDIPIKPIGAYVLTALAVMVFGRFVDLNVRAYAIHAFSIEQTGWWQAVVRIGDIYILPTTAIINTVFYPRITNSLHDKAVVKSYVNEVMRWVIPAAMLGFSLMFLMKEMVLVWVNAKGFEQAAYLMKYQLSGDFLRVISYFFASLLVAQARVKLMLVMEICSATVYLTAIYNFVPTMHIEGIALAHVIRYLFYTSTLYLIYRYQFYKS